MARAYLTALAEDLFAANNHYFLPIDAVEEVLKKIAGQKEPQPRDIWEVIEDLRDNELAPCRSDYGPIRNPRFYSPPTPAVVMEIIRRRFDPIRGDFRKVRNAAMAELIYYPPSIVRRIGHGGHAVIEASAGTGKTFAIEHLVIDLLLSGKCASSNCWS